MPLSDDEIREIAAQLRTPNGEKGLEVAAYMLTANRRMIEAAVSAIEPYSGMHILEIGHGGGGHIPDMLQSGGNCRYTGLEISESMYLHASAECSSLKNAEFRLYDGVHIPFHDATFDRVMTVNTVYFWADPGNFVREIARVMAQKGVFALCFGQKSYMEILPFTQYGFRLYDTKELSSILEENGFSIDAVYDYSEEIEGRTGEMLTRQFTCIRSVKC